MSILDSEQLAKLQKLRQLRPVDPDVVVLQGAFTDCLDTIAETTAQLAEARAALVAYKEACDMSPNELEKYIDEGVVQVMAERDRLKSDLTVVAGELEAMNANHRVMAGELAEMGREREKLTLLLPESFYAALTTHERVSFLVTHWQRAVQVNIKLEAQLSALTGLANGGK